MVTVKLFVEGGGDSGPLRSQCREGFRIFLMKAGFKRQPRIVACGGRQQTYDRFLTACKSNEMAMLLVDSEEFVADNSPWQHLAQRDNFQQPKGIGDDQCHLMVVCMESWFLADMDALLNYFGQGFNKNSLPKHNIIENISKNEIYNGIQNAISKCKAKDKYSKGRDSFAILGMISPDKVRDASPWAKRFLENLATLLR